MSAMIAAIKLLIHNTGSGTCSLTRQGGHDGLTRHVRGGNVREAFLSWKAFRQLLGLKAGKAAQKPAANGENVVVSPPSNVTKAK